ncbi:MAG: glycerol-3-phosphate dehydrogenase [Betaproteobacteria bacterium]
MHPPPDRVDLLVVGGGINGAGIARDAAGRGLTVLLVEQHDLGGATSSASSKLVHGGLRYLENYQFRLVAEALAEREVLLRTAPHIVHTKQFVMPHVPALRPAWMIRAGLLLYDYLARRQTLPRSRAIELNGNALGEALKRGPTRGFVYADCWVDDARLVVLTARAAADLGAVVLPRTACTAARRDGSAWRVKLRESAGREIELTARVLVNATGPWARRFLENTLGIVTPFNLKLVQGSHIVVPRLYTGDHAYILQNDDRRVIFVYAYEDRYTLIGTTEVPARAPEACTASEEEIAYLVRAANRYFQRQLTVDDVAWSYCGVRPLFDDGSANPSAISRDYVLRVDADAGATPVLSVFGGKITTYRRLAEQVMDRLAPWFDSLRPSRTAASPLPGGDFSGSVDSLIEQLGRRYSKLPRNLLRAFARRHGTLASRVLDGAQLPAQLGEHFGADLYEREVEYFVQEEWARSVEDVLWRRTKAGLHLSAIQQQAVANFVARRAGIAVR